VAAIAVSSMVQDIWLCGRHCGIQHGYRDGHGQNPGRS
jgi:hypothetical protein